MQQPQQINYPLLAQHIGHAIVRVQYGSAYCDKFYQTHLQRLQELGVPTAVYAWVRGVNHADMVQEARVFYERAKKFQPCFYWLDVEEQTMADMRGGVEMFRQTLKSLTQQKIGVYVAHHLYQQFNLAVENFDALWLPSYGTNSGRFQGVQPTVNKNFDLHQYTSNGHLPGYSGSLDLNRLSDRKKLDYFTGKTLATNTWGIAEKGTFILQSAIHLRTTPSSSAKSLAVLQPGQAVNYDAFSHEQGHVWIRQRRSDGTYGYLATGTSNGTQRTSAAWGQFK